MMDKADYPRCKTCKWWLSDGACALLSEATRDDIPEPLWETARAVTTALYGYDSWLLTDANFGCLKHEPREDA